MAPSFFSSSGSASNAKYFDIRLDEDYVVFRGTEHEAGSVQLKGTVVLCLSEPLTIKHLKLHLTGMSRICCLLPAGSVGPGRKQVKERSFLEKTWEFRDAGKGKTEILPADNYEFPFDVVLPGTLPESVEGLQDAWVAYRFKAEIGRKYAKDIHVRKPLRIIRTLSPAALELAHTMSLENVWPNKIEYAITTASKAVIFGTSLRVDFRILPLLKGLKIGNIISQLVENQELSLSPGDLETVQNTRSTVRVITRDTYTLGDEQQAELLDEEAGGYQFSRVLDLPKTLSKCMQDTDTEGIKIKHRLKFRIQLHNPDGHTSELRATLPVSVFISPNLPIDDNNNLVDQTPQSAQRAAATFTQQAPPLYEEHQFDQLYSELDPSGYQTPGTHSGYSTPITSHSRSASAENISSANVARSEAFCLSTLQTRLSNLHVSSSSPATPPPDTPEVTAEPGEPRRLSYTVGDDTVPITTSTTGDPITPEASRRGSEEGQLPFETISANPPYGDPEDLSRVPSYSTAVRSTRRTRYSSDLPGYEAATAGNSSTTSSVTRAPRHVHLRGVSWAFPFSELTHLPHHLFHDRGHGGNVHAHVQDPDRRLRLLQARARG